MGMKNHIFGMMAVLVMTASISAAPLDPNTIVVSGTAEVLVNPDYATIDIGVVTSNKVTAAALQENNIEMNRVVAAIKALGIAEKSMQTSNFSIDVLHPKTKNGEDDESKIAAYEVTNKLTVTVSDLAKVADIIDTAVKAGANSSNSVSFDVKDRRAYDDQVLAAAVRDARHHAEVMAAVEHAIVGKMVSLTNVPSVGYGGVNAPPAEAILIKEEHVPVLPGQISINANVQVIFALQ